MTEEQVVRGKALLAKLKKAMEKPKPKTYIEPVYDEIYFEALRALEREDD